MVENWIFNFACCEQEKEGEEVEDAQRCDVMIKDSKLIPYSALDELLRTYTFN